MAVKTQILSASRAGLGSVVVTDDSAYRKVWVLSNLGVEDTTGLVPPKQGLAKAVGRAAGSGHAVARGQWLRDDELPPASDKLINDGIDAVYTACESAGLTPPNVNDGRKPIQDWVRAKGRYASGHRIRELCRAENFKRRRGKVGKTRASEKKPG